VTSKTQAVQAFPWPDQPSTPFPGAAGWINLPRERRLARSGIAAYSACRPTAIAAQSLACVAAATIGPRPLGSSRALACPIPADVWSDLTRQWRSQLGAFDGVIPLLRRQPERVGFAVLLHRGGRRVAFIKLRKGDPGPEPLLLLAAERLTHESFWSPRLLGRGQVEGWTWFAAQPLPGRVHLPARTPTTDLLAEVRAVVEEALPLPGDVPEGWRGSHGDLNPWNVRRLGGKHVVFDWEDARWAPEAADLVGYLASSAALRGRSRAVIPRDILLNGNALEAANYWLTMIRERDRSSSDRAYNERLIRVLELLTREARENT
jgi:hypothetical protein